MTQHGNGSPIRRPSGLACAGAAMLALAFATPVAGQEGPAPIDTINVIALDTVRVGARADDLLGIAPSASIGRVGRPDLDARPITRTGELLESVPGLIVTQHSGDGKANQYFVRGFNLDHGTDFSTKVEGMPVNMPTHGHGQGYTDLNFMIPELVELLDYRMGVYHALLGDFGSAGGAEIHFARELERPFAEIGVGEYGYRRGVAGASAEFAGGTALVAGEARLYEGPWEMGQGVEKVNGLARYSRSTPSRRFSVLAMAYDNAWKATDQVPLRAVESGRIGRFGNIDPSDGGASQRYSLSTAWDRIGQNSLLRLEAYAVRSELELFSNFTFFLGDEAGGDQFRQIDRRTVLGGRASWTRQLDERRRHTATVGLDQRTDLIDEVGLALTSQRRVVDPIRNDAVTESATGLWMEMESRWTQRFRTRLGLRGDGYWFDVDADLTANSGTRSAAIASPKASVVYQVAPDWELSLNGGLGFHSNDARGTTISVDPVTGLAADPVDPLVRSRGIEAGLRGMPHPTLRTTLSLWALNLDSELLFVGDGGSTEPLGASRRRGVTLTATLRPVSNLLLDGDLSLASARLVDGVDDRVPGALDRVAVAGLAWAPDTGFRVGARVRHFGGYPLTEDGVVEADASTLVNASVGYALRRKLRVELELLNALDSTASDVEYFYESRLPGEPSGGFADVHFHPTEPRQVRAMVKVEM